MFWAILLGCGELGGYLHYRWLRRRYIEELSASDPQAVLSTSYIPLWVLLALWIYRQCCVGWLRFLHGFRPMVTPHGARAWIRRGAAQGPTVLFFPGLGYGVVPYAGWLVQAARRDANVNWIAFEMPNFSIALTTQRLISLQTHLEALDSILASHGHETVHIAAHSLGAVFARQFMAQTALKTGKIALLAPTCFPVRTDAYLRPINRVRSWRDRKDYRGWKHLLLEKLVFEYLRIQRAVKSMHVTASEWREDFSTDRALVVLAEQDTLVHAPSTLTYLQRHHPRVQARVASRARHMLWFEKNAAQDDSEVVLQHLLPKEDMVWVFCYGANMSTALLAKKHIAPQRAMRARLVHWQRTLTHRGVPWIEPSFANIEPKPHAAVEGVLMGLRSAAWARMQRSEYGYAPERITVDTENGTEQSCYALCSRPRWRLAKERRCSQRYLALLRQGAEEWGLTQTLSGLEEMAQAPMGVGRRALEALGKAAYAIRYLR